MDLETILKKAREIKAEIDAEYTNATAWRLDDANAVEAYMENVKRLAQIIKTKVEFLGFYVERYEARRDYPQKADALNLCDKTLVRLDTIRDIIARAIDGDDAVECSEIDAEIVIGCLDNALDYIKQAAEYAKEKDADLNED